MQRDEGVAVLQLLYDGRVDAGSASFAANAARMAEQTERGDALFTLMLNRHGRHALDMGALDRLR